MDYLAEVWYQAKKLVQNEQYSIWYPTDHHARTRLTQEMSKHKVQSIGDLITQFIAGTELEKTLLEKQVVQLWPQVMGTMVANLTGEMEVKNSVLIVHIHSAALRQQLFECRYDIIKKLNEAIHTNYIKDIRLLG